MKLYQLPISHFSAKVRIVALEKGVDLELPPIPGGSTRSPEFLAVNPLGKVPVLVDGELALGESEVIVEYLEERFPEPRLLPESLEGRARSRWLSRYHDLYVAPQLSKLYGGVLAGRLADPEMLTEVDALHEMLDVVEESVSDGPFFLGEQFAACDASFCLSYWYAVGLSQQYGEPVSAGRFPKLSAWFERASERPSVAGVIQDTQAALANG